ncbi:19806_t:CDS:2 [Gigaspora rosea]|nr:19806_t:CDS:2 [Gigaspora rosea]
MSPHVLRSSTHNHPHNNCSNYLIQPQLNNDNRQYKGNILNDRIVDDGYPAFAINIFDSVNKKTMAAKKYDEFVKNTYFEKSNTFVTSSFRKNRFFLGRNMTYHVRMTRQVTNLIMPSFWDSLGFTPKYDTYLNPATRNNTYFMSVASEFMIDPNDFMVETQIEQRNNSAPSVISNALAIAGTLPILDVFLFGFRAKKLWLLYILRNTIDKSHRNILQTQLAQLVEEINKLKDFLCTVLILNCTSIRKA